jgi:hypothetical protein
MKGNQRFKVPNCRGGCVSRKFWERMSVAVSMFHTQHFSPCFRAPDRAARRSH